MSDAPPAPEAPAVPAMGAEPAAMAVETPPAPVTPPAPPPPPAWKAVVAEADEKAGAEPPDWAAAARLIVRARTLGATDADIGKTLLGGVNRYVAAPDLNVTEPAEGAKVADTRVRIASTARRRPRTASR